MKKMLGISVAILAVGLILTACVGAQKDTMTASGAMEPNLVVYPAVVKMDKKATAFIMGSGFEPGKEILILLTTADGVKSDIGYSFEPEPVPNKMGAWASEWKDCGRYISSELVKEGVYVITVTDGEYHPLAEAPIAFTAGEKEKKK
jgi:hypothetical protein